MEGININYNGAADNSIPFMYVAMAEVRGAMADTTGDIQVQENRCGAVYRLGLDMQYNASRMDRVVVGGAYDATSTADRCDPEGIAQPDNIEILDDGRVAIYDAPTLHVYDPSSGSWAHSTLEGWYSPGSSSNGQVEQIGDHPSRAEQGAG